MAGGHRPTGSVSQTQNQKAQLANAYNELGKELSSNKLRVVGNYTLGRVIGEGAYGKVRMGTHRLTSTRVAIKQIPKAMSSSLTREIHHHRQLHHPHVTQMYEVIATESSIWIVTELCSGGELFDYLVEKGRLTEEEAKIIFGQLCLAVAYLHDKGIVHRDLKLENVLLDERCRVKLGDFGFTREFERGSFMETFCGTTGYASPEMLQGKKYMGPEVDVWSLGIILYCLLTGTLPFDDDDERVMRDKIVLGEFEDPEWLSDDVRDLIQSVLQQDPSKRLTIPQILGHAWFASGSKIPHNMGQSDVSLPLDRAESPSPASRKAESPLPPLPTKAESPLPPIPNSPEPRSSTEHSSASDSTYLSSEFATTAPTTPDIDDPFDQSYVPEKYRNYNTSQTTIKKPSDNSEDVKPVIKPETVFEEEDTDVDLTPAPNRIKAPPMHTLRTPARTKRRSVSSTLSDPDAPEEERTPTLPAPQASRDIDFANLLSTPASIIFSTPLERKLLNSLSDLGYDTGQIVYSVLNDACDAAGAVWWMLVRKAERKAIEDAADISMTFSPESPSRSKRKPNHVNACIQTEAGMGMQVDVGRGTPHLGLVPPTPTAAVGTRPMTPPPRSGSPGQSLLTPSSSVILDSSKSNPSTPGGTGSSKSGRKGRSGSVSIMQRATTALEAAGLVRKKSSEAIREQQSKEKDKSKDKEKDGKSKTDESRSSHGSSRLTKSPPLRATPAPTTPPPSEIYHEVGASSPWVLTEREQTRPRSAPTPANSPGEFIGSSTPYASVGKTNNRHRGNFLNTFRFWLNEEKKNKRKEAAAPSKYGQNRSPAGQTYGPNGVSKRNNSSSGGGGTRGRRRSHRPSMSSRRSSSVNSHRSSVTSVQMMVLDSPQMQGRQSFGTHTPNPESEGYPSRPSSVRSFSHQHHRKSPSASSINSQQFHRTASPMQKYQSHRRGGSGSSTRVVRQTQRPTHGRSNSAASSIHSPVSSRPTSIIDFSESEGGRGTSPYRQRRGSDESRQRGNFTFVAHKKGASFASPLYGYGGSTGRSSWKKSWGLEPPGWQTRTTQLPVEVIAISPINENTSVRDVFASKQSGNTAGDESDWIDEDDDIPYLGGLGQVAMSSSSSASKGLTLKIDPPPPAMLSPPPRSHKRTSPKAGNSNSSSTGSRQKRNGSHSPVRSSAPQANETETRGSRRHLPPGRNKPPALTITEEEEEEEEED